MGETLIETAEQSKSRADLEGPDDPVGVSASASAIAFGVGGLLFFAVLDQLDLLRSPIGSFAFWPAIGALLCGAAGYGLRVLANDRQRHIFGVVAGAVIGLIIGSMVFRAYRPVFDWVPLLSATLAGALLFAIFGGARRNAVAMTAFGAALGWFFGAFGFSATNPRGSQLWAIIAVMVPMSLLGLWAAWNRRDTALFWNDRATESTFNPKAWIVVGPALTLAVAVGLVPGLQTEQGVDIIDKIVSTLIGVAIAVAASAGLWVGVNLLFKQATEHWRRFQALSFGLVGFVLFFILSGNRLLRAPGGRKELADAIESITNWSSPLTMAIVIGFVGFLIGRAIGSYQGSRGIEIPAAAVGALLGMLLGLTRTDEVAGGFFTTILFWPIIGAAVAGVVGWILGGTENSQSRLLVGGVGGLVLGLITGFQLFREYRPEVSPVSLIVGLVVGAVVAVAVMAARGKPPLPTVFLGASVGALIGGVALPDADPRASQLWGVVAVALPFVLAGLWAAARPLPGLTGRTAVDQKSRSWIFLGPALSFIAITLVIPALRTLLLSLFGNKEESETFVGLENYGEIFGNRLNEESFNFERWRELFSSQLVLIGVPLLLLGAVLGILLGRSTGERFRTGGLSATPIGIAMVLLMFAVFTTLRGTIINNLWWVFTVTVASTAIGLAIAALADRVRSEKYAKAFIFMPMAISFVGASIIWRAIYQARNVNKPQTGVLNALWVGLGRLSTGSGLPTLLVTIGLFALLALIAAFLLRALQTRNTNGVAPALTVGALLVWFTYRFVGPGVGGQRIGPNGDIIADPVLFVQQSPFNSFWLMVILIWIQTGFAMVILSAAIKAVPGEFIEAARVDGASDSQIFWRITLPQILPTVGVVVTTTIVVVMKVFDIVKVITNGQFDSQVLANQMFNEAFSFANQGTGAALAIILFISVLPVMVYNIRQMQKAEF